MKAGDLVAGNVIEVLGERLTVTGPARVERTTAVIDAASATEEVTLYLRATADVALVRKGRPAGDDDGASGRASGLDRVGARRGA